MSLTSTWRTRIVGTIAAVLAVIMAVEVAEGQYFLPVLCMGISTAIGIIHFQPHPLSTIVLGLTVVGYVVGNRGFAQLSVAGRFPLLPAELALLVAGGTFLVNCALRREPPFRRDALNLAILAWMLCSSFRLAVDVRAHGFTAIRDYATVYYGAFFFLAQWAGRNAADRHFFAQCLYGACGALLVVYPLFTFFPDFFLGTLVIRGVPLIFFKGDLAGTFMAVGAVLFFLRHEQSRSWWPLIISLALTGAVISTNNRASLLGLIVATGLLALRGRWRFAAYQSGAGVAASVVLVLAAHLQNRTWHDTPLYGVYERAVSLVDPQGKRTYSGDETFNKGDNNLFRLVWWQTVIDETIAGNRWVGLGWGYDLAEPFLRVYYPEGGDEFSTRSPHNIVITVFARTGLAGLIPFLFVVGAIIVRAWRAVRHGNLLIAGWWCSTCVILTSACLGVVLEGPMGAVVFWVVLGLANAAWRAENESTDSNSVEAEKDPHLRTAKPADQLAAAS